MPTRYEQRLFTILHGLRIDPVGHPIQPRVSVRAAAPPVRPVRARGATAHPTRRPEAETGVWTTARQLTGEQQPNFSLCHGLAGNAEVLLEASDVLQTPAWRWRAEAVGRIGQERHQKTGLWTNGLYNDYQIPDFMLVLSGTGYFYLRLAKPETYRSVLLLR